MADKYAEIAQFEQKVKMLIEKYAALKLANEKLTAELSQGKKELMEAHKSIVELHDLCNHLRTANAIAVTDEERLKAKDRLGKMVREIDNCIALLKN